MSAPRPWMKSWRKTRRSTQERAKRIRILNAELDVLRGASSERSRTIDTKASFVVVVAGVLASVTGLSLVTLDTWLVGLLPFGLTIAAVAVATAALWPRKIDLPSAREVVDAWVDADMPADELEDNVLEVKAQEVTNRDKQNEKRAELTNWGFGLVLAGLVTTLAVVTLNALSPTWSSHDEAEPTQTPVSTQAPATPSRVDGDADADAQRRHAHGEAMIDDPKPSADPASTRPDVEVVFKEVMATEHGKPKEQR